MCWEWILTIHTEMQSLEKHCKQEVFGSQPFQIKDTQPILYPLNLFSSIFEAKEHPSYSFELGKEHEKERTKNLDKQKRLALHQRSLLPWAWDPIIETPAGILE